MSISMSDQQKQFEFCFVDESSSRKLTFEYGSDDDELLRFGQENGEIFLFANRSGCLALAKILIKLALSGYQSGYHVHVGEDFSANGLCLGLLSEDNRIDAGETDSRKDEK